MKRLLPACALALAAAHTAANPSFTVGTDPARTMFSFPHRLLELSPRAAGLQFGWIPMPWMGNISDPPARPNDSYTSNYQSVDFPTPEDWSGDPAAIASSASFQGRYDQYQLAANYRLPVGGVRAYFELGGAFHDMELAATGTARGYELAGSTRAYSVKAFDALTANARATAWARAVAAAEPGGVPVGLKADFEYLFPNAPRGHLRVDGVEDGRLTWGWASVGCANIFGFAHRDDVIDAFALDYYDVSSGYKLNLQASAALGPWEPAFHLRYEDSAGSRHYWNAASREYAAQADRQRSWRNLMLRGFAKRRIASRGPLRLGVLGFLEFDSRRSAEDKIGSGRVAFPWTWLQEYDAIAELNPYLNLDLGSGAFLDIGLLVEGAYQGFDNRRRLWNDKYQSELETYLDAVGSGYPIRGWTAWWEPYSYSRTGFFATGFEATARLPVTKEIAFQLGSLAMLKLTGERRVYGSNDSTGGGDWAFAEHFARRGFKRELWMTGGAGLSLRSGPVVQTLGVDFPLAYLLYASTDLEDLDAGESLFDHVKSNVFAVQEPFKVRYSASLALR